MTPETIFPLLTPKKIPGKGKGRLAIKVHRLEQLVKLFGANDDSGNIVVIWRICGESAFAGQVRAAPPLHYGLALCWSGLRHRRNDPLFRTPEFDWEKFWFNFIAAWH